MEDLGDIPETITNPAVTQDRREVFNGLLKTGIQKRDTELVTLALKNGAEPNLLLFAGIMHKPGSWERLRGQNLEIGRDWVELALEQGADANATWLYKDEKPWPAIHWAQAYFNPGVMTLLIDNGAPVDTLSPQGRTPLMDAVLSGYAEEIEYYLSKGADPLCRCAGEDFPLKALGRSEKFDADEKMRLTKLMMHHSIPESPAAEFRAAAQVAPRASDPKLVVGKKFSI